MKFFADFHHSGAARGLFLALKYRLGHDVYFPDDKFASYASTLFGTPGTWLGMNPSYPKVHGGIPKKYLNADETFPFIISKEQFLQEDWDAVFVTRIESQKVFKELMRMHPNAKNIKFIGSMGNECTVFDWQIIKNLMVSDYLSHVVAPKNINKLHYSQEMGTQYAEENVEFSPIKKENLKNIYTFINCLSSFTGPWRWDSEQSGYNGKCPHCDGVPDLSNHGPYSPFGIWNELKNKLPDHNFLDFGIVNSQGVVDEKALPHKYKESALTWHFKTYDGYGYSLLQSVAMGRLALIPRRFHRYRTANRYLINNLTCLEAEWDVDNIVEKIKYFTSNLDRANTYSEACFNASKHLFNWKLEAFRINEFLNNLQ